MHASWVDRCRQAASSGRVLDFGARTGKPGLAAPFCKSSGRVIPGQAIRDALLDPQLKPDALGLRIQGAYISGVLNLDHAALACPLVLEKCEFENPPSLAHCTAPGLSFTGATLPGLRLSFAQIAGRIRLDGITVQGPVDMQAAQMESLDLTGAVLTNPDHESLNLSRCRISGTAEVRVKKSEGTIFAFGAQIGHLDMTGAHLVSTGTALDLSKAEIAGNANLTKPLTIQGAVIAADAQFGQLTMTGATLRADAEIALNLSRVKVSGTAYLNHGFHLSGMLLAFKASFGQLDMIKAVIHKEDGTALDLSRAEVAGGAFLRELQIHGNFTAADAAFSELILTEAELSRPGHKALNLARAKVAGNVTLSGLMAQGSLHLNHAIIGGRLELDDPHQTDGVYSLDNSDGPALNFDGAQIASAFILSSRNISGLVSGVGARLGGQLDMNHSQFLCPAGDALDLSRMESSSGIRFLNVTVSGHVRCFGARLLELTLHNSSFDSGGINPLSGDALDLGSSTITTLNLHDKVEAVQGINFTGTTIHNLATHASDLPKVAAAHGWKINSLHGGLEAEPDQAIKWLDTMKSSQSQRSESFDSQPWKEMGAAYDQMGRPEDARRIRYQAARRTTRVAAPGRRILRMLYSAFVGYGYYPLRAGTWLVASWLIVAIISFAVPGDFVATKPQTSPTPGPTSTSRPLTGLDKNLPAGQPTFNPALYAADLTIPAAKTGQEASWQGPRNNWIQALFVVVKILSWLWTAVFIAGVTGLLRKD
jgi:uncharacterized protein YjbI with pentapeptide repeats